MCRISLCSECGRLCPLCLQMVFLRLQGLCSFSSSFLPLFEQEQFYVSFLSCTLLITWVTQIWLQSSVAQTRGVASSASFPRCPYPTERPEHLLLMSPRRTTPPPQPSCPALGVSPTRLRACAFTPSCLAPAVLPPLVPVGFAWIHCVSQVQWNVSQGSFEIHSDAKRAGTRDTCIL